MTYYCAWPLYQCLKGVFSAMAADTCNGDYGIDFDHESSEQKGFASTQTVSTQTAVALTYRATQILVDTESVCGCVGIERPSRIPGSSKNVKGLILFKGETVPLVSFFGGTAERSVRERLTQSRKTEDYAVVLSIKGATLAARVDEPPRICADKTLLEQTGRNICYMRRRHLERLLDLYMDQRSNGCLGARKQKAEVGSESRQKAQAESDDRHKTQGQNHDKQNDSPQEYDKQKYGKERDDREKDVTQELAAPAALLEE